jgi:hypothetical protein
VVRKGGGRGIRVTADLGYATSHRPVRDVVEASAVAQGALLVSDLVGCRGLGLRPAPELTGSPRRPPGDRSERRLRRGVRPEQTDPGVLAASPDRPGTRVPECPAGRAGAHPQCADRATRRPSRQKSARPDPAHHRPCRTTSALHPRASATPTRPLHRPRDPRSRTDTLLGVASDTEARVILARRESPRELPAAASCSDARGAPARALD